METSKGYRIQTLKRKDGVKDGIKQIKDDGQMGTVGEGYSGSTV